MSKNARHENRINRRRLRRSLAGALVALLAASGLSVATVAGAGAANAAGTATISLTKALGSARVYDTDQFTMQIHTGSASGPVVSDATNATTQGTGSAVTAGTGTTGAFAATAGTKYFLTEATAGTANPANYTQTITCSDANNVQTGLPTNQAFSASLQITPVSGAAISCTLTNSPPAPIVCTVSTAYLSQGEQGDPTRLYARQFGAGAATFTPIGPAAAFQYNAIAVDPLDGYIYGQKVATGAQDGDVLRINPNTGAVTDIGATVPSTVSGNAGAFDAAGNYYTMVGSSTKLTTVNVDTLAATTITSARFPTRPTSPLRTASSGGPPDPTRRSAASCGSTRPPAP